MTIPDFTDEQKDCLRKYIRRGRKSFQAGDHSTRPTWPGIDNDFLKYLYWAFNYGHFTEGGEGSNGEVSDFFRGLENNA